MSTEMKTPAVTIGAEVTLCEEVPMVRRERWEEFRRWWVTERVPIAEIARRLDLDCKTVRRCKARQNILYTSAEINRLYSALRCPGLPPHAQLQ